MLISQESQQFESSLIEIEFYGPSLDTRSIPVLDLGQTLIATQRMINKTYLFSQGRLNTQENRTRGMSMTDTERETLSLQLVSRRKNSDVYGLTTFVTDPQTLNFMKEVIINFLGGLSVYIVQSVVSKKNEPPLLLQPLVISIYPDLKNISERIQPRKGIEAIGFSITGQRNTKNNIIDYQTKEYLKSLLHERVYGFKQKLQGRVRDINLGSSFVDLDIGPNIKVKVFMKPDVLDKIRYSESKQPHVEFEGSPLYRLGSETPSFEEFQAESCKILDFGI